jgi:phosphoinositide-3-kinase regulatory subunit 4
MDVNLELYNKFFGDLDNNSRCYLAPERWRSPPKTAEGGKVTSQMDIFSTGCVIAEILLDGTPLFDLPGMTSYRKGDTLNKFDPE